jgi:hypothetical protein
MILYTKLMLIKKRHLGDLQCVNHVGVRRAINAAKRLSMAFVPAATSQPINVPARKNPKNNIFLNTTSNAALRRRGAVLLWYN